MLKKCCQACRAAWFNKHLHTRQKQQNRLRNRIIGDRNNIIRVALDIPKCPLTWRFNRDAIGDCIYGQLAWNEVPRFEGTRCGIRAFRLHTNHTQTRLCFLEGTRNAREKAAAANRDDDGVDIRQLLQQFDTERALSRDNAIIVISGHKNPPLRFGNTLCDSDSLIEIFTVENNIRSVATRRFNLGIACGTRHDYPARNTCFATR